MIRLCTVRFSNHPHQTNDPRAWYGARITEFLDARAESIIGQLTSHSDFAVIPTQRDAWLMQIRLLQSALVGMPGSIFLEYSIPRMGRRVDAVLLLGPMVVVMEFKVGESAFDRAALDQVWDYALDLKNFHAGSHHLSLVPVLLATAAKQSCTPFLQCDKDQVYRPVPVSPNGLRPLLEELLKMETKLCQDGSTWVAAPYLPTPTIVEAARALYAQHSVESIARSDAGAKNLALTSRCVEDIIDEARAIGRKVICFVTGVPGAGKTLVGLNVATQRRDKHAPTHAVFLSGNGPLVSVLREALTRDEVIRRKEQGEQVRKGKVGESVKAFIQNVHHFRDDALADDSPPPEHVVIFDEAQRAWNLQQTANFMQRKKNQHGFNQSEPEFLIRFMDRHPNWAVIVCLVGGGQEINTGEAGIEAWLEAVCTQFPHWQLVISPKLTDSEYGAGSTLQTLHQSTNARFDDALHLAVSMRSFRAEHVSAFVKAMLDGEIEQARRAFEQIAARFPIVLTRNLDNAKKWIRSQARGSERYGLVASSRAQRLKPHAIDIRVKIDPIHWFLNHRDDTRSSYYLEDAATEFQVQGLELDWVCVNWDADLRHTGQADAGAASAWTHHDFRGDRWTNIKNSDNQAYLRNAYRVLLTRARQGMVLFIPNGDLTDPTRNPAYYDRTYAYLHNLGIPTL